LLLNNGSNIIHNGQHFINLSDQDILKLSRFLFRDIIKTI